MTTPEDNAGTPPESGGTALPAQEQVGGAAGGLREGRFASRQVFQQAIRDLLQQAAEQGWSELMLSDPTFEDWPLGESAVAQSLNSWSKGGRKLILMANSFTALQRDQARFVRWRQTWDHIIECRRCMPVQGTPLPSALWTPEWLLHRFDGDLFQGYLGREASRRFQLRERLTECLKKSSPGFPASTLGL